MIRGLFKLILLVIVVVAVGMFFLGRNFTDRDADVAATREAAKEAGESVGTAGRTAAERGRQAGAEIGERAGQAAAGAQRALADGSLTAKIKAKMGLDDSVKALNLNVDTVNGVVTVKGVAGSEAEKQRALQLARETEGVKQVVDQVTVR